MFIIRCATLVSILISVASSPAHVGAGIAVDPNGILTSATVTADGSTYIGVSFVQSSWAGLTTDQKGKIFSAPWYTGAHINSEAIVVKYAEDLRDQILNIPQIYFRYGTPPDQSIGYYFGYYDAPNDGSGPYSVVTFYHEGASFWTSGTGYIPLEGITSQTISTNINPSTIYWAIPDTQSNVPEPSTAIAMGLLGIVGFAGNRRRRRQVSVA